MIRRPKPLEWVRPLLRDPRAPWSFRSGSASGTAPVLSGTFRRSSSILRRPYRGSGSVESKTRLLRRIVRDGTNRQHFCRLWEGFTGEFQSTISTSFWCCKYSGNGVGERKIANMSTMVIFGLGARKLANISTMVIFGLGVVIDFNRLRLAYLLRFSTHTNWHHTLLAC